MNEEGKTERKVIQGGLWGAVTVILVWMFEAIVQVWLPEYQMPAPVAQAWTIVFSTAGAWYQP